MFEFIFHTVWCSCALVWLVAFAAFSLEVWHRDTPDDGQGN